MHGVDQAVVAVWVISDILPIGVFIFLFYFIYFFEGLRLNVLTSDDLKSCKVISFSTFSKRFSIHRTLPM